MLAAGKEVINVKGFQEVTYKWVKITEQVSSSQQIMCWVLEVFHEDNV